jgi:ankyrin repeat protein
MYTRVVAACIDNGVSLEMKNDVGKTALQLASVNGCLETVKLLTRHGASIDITDNDGCTSLHLALDADLSMVKEDSIRMIRDEMLKW